MKVIFSRKGFDSKYGGYASPILPNNKLVSLPIPSDDLTTYSKLKLDEENTYFDLMKQLKNTIRIDGKLQVLTNKTECHLDPDIYSNITPRNKNWRGCFGQVGHSQTHLQNKDVKEGDLFLFFGWFRQTEIINNKLCFKKKAPDLHIIFGYLQIDKILTIKNEQTIPLEIKTHPHIQEKYAQNNNNTIYIAKKSLTWNKNLPGWGTFNLNKELILTKKGLSRTKWDLPSFFKQVNISRHSKNSWKPEGYFKSAEIGQEFVIEKNSEVEKWAKKLINKQH